MSTALETMKDNRDLALSEAGRLEGYIADMTKTIDRYQREADEHKKTASAYQVAIDALDTDRG